MNKEVTIECGPEEPKQETLEEAAEKHIPNRIRSTPFGSKYEWEPKKERRAFIAGVKWQQERMYSEEEVFNICREFAVFVQQKRPSYKKQLEWFEQFKKK